MNIHSVCLKHDTAYVQQVVTRKEADVDFLVDALNAEVRPVVCMIYYGIIRALGWVWWYRRKLKNGKR
jgi:hypothetical protein